MIARLKQALDRRHPELRWRVHDNYHYGDQLDGLDLVIYRMGDFVKGRATHLLSYDCDTRAYRQAVIEELRRGASPSLGGKTSATNGNH